jgi:hypothetical protein
MGYCYDHRNRLCCDACGNAGGVRKRICTATVLTDSVRGPRSTLRYCSPPALCPTWYRKRGSAAGIHADCAQYAANAQQEYDAIEPRRDHPPPASGGHVRSHSPFKPSEQGRVTGGRNPQIHPHR